MNNVVNLARYRSKTRKAYLAKYGSRIDRLLANFIRNHMDVDFLQLAEDYQSGRQDLDMVSWDYVDFREILTESLDQVFGAKLYELLKQQPWFDSALIRQDEIVERCLTTFVLGPANAASKP
jgi:hypothetical protein